MSQPQAYPILEFDSDPQAILNPPQVDLKFPTPERVVLCFFQDVLRSMLQEGRLEEIYHLGSEIGLNPLYRLVENGVPVLVLHPGVGAPLAAAFLDEMIAMGARKFVACGGCGVLHPEIAAGHPVVLTGAVRDEGTSYHYLAPSREVSADAEAVAALEAVCQERGIEYRLGKAWTTDAFYRETAAKRAQRLAEGCEVVEMEAAAFFAVAQFRGVKLGQVVYGGDLVVPEGWDLREWHRREDDRRLMFELALAAVLKL
jgi:uridine phosphorylase